MRFGLAACFLLHALAATAQTGNDKKKTDKKKIEKKTDKKPSPVWTAAADPSLPIDFKFQGEYLVKGKNDQVGCQVIALGNGAFQAVLCKGGLPGMGWDGKSKALMDGKLEGDKVVFVPTTGKRKYLGQAPSEFSATSKFPPEGNKEFTATLVGDVLTVVESRTPIELKKITRKSPTLGEKGPAGALTLFDGTNTDEWKGGRLDMKTGFLNTDGKDITTKRKFNNYTRPRRIHAPLPPRRPRPGARQQRLLPGRSLRSADPRFVRPGRQR